MTLPARLSLLLSAGLLSACEITPDPCADYQLACIAVTVAAGPDAVHQLQVIVEDYSSTTPLTPRSLTAAPLAYPMRFAVKFTQEFDNFHRGTVILDVVGLSEDNQVLAEARQPVAIRGIEKTRVTLRLGDPLDLSGPVDQRPAPDLSVAAPDLSRSDLADGGGAD